MYGFKLPTALNLGMDTPQVPSFEVRLDAAEAIAFAAIKMKEQYDKKHTPKMVRYCMKDMQNEILFMSLH